MTTGRRSLVGALLSCELIATACTGEAGGPKPSPGDPRPSPSVDTRLSTEALVARYCFHAVDAIDAFALREESRVSDALALVEEDVQVLSDDIEREADDLEHFLTQEAPREVIRPSRAGWRLAHTPDRCLAVDTALAELRLAELTQLQRAKWRTSSEWAGAASTLDIRFYVSILSARDEDCVNHLVLDTQGLYQRAFTSDCLGWSQPFSFFLVSVTVIGTNPVTVRLGDFAVLSRTGETFRAVDIRGQTSNPEALWEPEVKIRPGREVRSYVAFNAPDLHVRALGVEIGDELFVIAFGPKERLQARAQ